MGASLRSRSWVSEEADKKSALQEAKVFWFFFSKKNCFLLT
jgi:hypothetical protein